MVAASSGGSGGGISRHYFVLGTSAPSRSHTPRLHHTTVGPTHRALGTRQSSGYLQGDELVIDDGVLRQEVRPDRGLVLVRKALVHVLIHERRLPHPERSCGVCGMFALQGKRLSDKLARVDQ